MLISAYQIVYLNVELNEWCNSKNKGKGSDDYMSNLSPSPSSTNCFSIPSVSLLPEILFLQWAVLEQKEKEVVGREQRDVLIMLV